MSECDWHQFTAHLFAIARMPQSSWRAKKADLLFALEKTGGTKDFMEVLSWFGVDLEEEFPTTWHVTK